MLTMIKLKLNLTGKSKCDRKIYKIKGLYLFFP